MGKIKGRQLELSIIIPTLNEEKALPRLLNSLKSNLKNINAEVLVIDAHSKDKTVKVAKKAKIRNLKIFQPKKKGQSYQRNYGAWKARAPLLMFLDADVVLPKGFLEKALREIIERNLDAASCLSKVGEEGLRALWEKLCYDVIGNTWIRSFERWKPYGHCCFFMKRDIHYKIGGFDERLFFGEDSEYIERAVKKGKARFGVLKSTNFIISTRGFKKYGRLAHTIAFAYLNLCRLIGRERRKKGESTSELYEKFRKMTEPKELGKQLGTGIVKAAEYHKTLKVTAERPNYMIYQPLYPLKQENRKKRKK
ncbi:MAG: glycosyltransferase [Candidatus Pacearchaeota archaeon]